MSFGEIKDPVVGIEFVLVKGGCFEMGSFLTNGDAKPTHQVCLEDFYMGKYEVTQGQWKAVMAGNPSENRAGDNYPVENVSWEDVQEFIGRLNKLTGGKYRLPTEAEWEYAARSGGKKERWAGTNDHMELKEYAWYEENSSLATHPVGQKRPNGAGLYDMCGNVLEWVADWYGEKYYHDSPKNNPEGPSSGDAKVLRGGCFDLDLWDISAWRRCRNAPSVRDRDYGFRLASSL